jgi:ribosomal protein S18 acetylase RimI-like enzyme
MTPNLRPVRAEDAPFLFDLYCSTRQAELAAWGWDPAQQAAFLRLQFQAHEQFYGAQGAAADLRIVLVAGEPVGRLTVVRGAGELRLADIALLPAWRNAGLGTALIQQVLAEAALCGLPLRLQVALGNPAIRLYTRLGFAVTSRTDTDWQMEARPAPPGDPAPGAPDPPPGS